MRKNRIQIIIIGIAVIVLSLLYFFYPATKNSFHPSCVFRSVTGLNCPGCGSQRAISALLRVDFLQAVSYNILLVISLPFVLYSAIIFTLNAFRKEQIQQKLFHQNWFIKLVFIVVILFWILRNIPQYPFSLFAPHEL